MLRVVAIEVVDEKETDPITKERIKNMLQFVETTSNWYEKIQAIPTSTLQKIMKLGAGITKFVKKVSGNNKQPATSSTVSCSSVRMNQIDTPVLFSSAPP